MAYSTTGLYPEDLNGNLASNLITETQTLQAPGPDDYYFIIPKAAPFFVTDLKVVQVTGNKTLVEGDDYQVGHLFVEAMESIGRPIAGSIRFMKPTIIGQVKITYRTIGGDWGFDDTAILRELSNKALNPLIRSWGDIDVLPYSFPPLPHDQKIDTLTGSTQINATLNRIADILEASASGSSASHLADFNNPHRVTKTQVGLGNVPNFMMATDQQHLDASRNDLFTNPRGVLLLVNKFAVDPMNNHISATGNVHHMVPSDINLGNVPNWLPATPTQAIDPTNNNTFMTPYLTSLLVQKLQNDPRLDQLIIDFNAHLSATNPHHITPAMIGTYTSQQIDAMIDQLEVGGDAQTFGGQTPNQWEAKFPSVDDINEILKQLTDTWTTANTALTLLDVTDPVKPTDEQLKEGSKIAWTFGGYGAYALYNALGAGQLVADATVSSQFPTTPVDGLAGTWATAPNAAYYIQPDGSLKSWGSNAITIPVGYATGAGFQTANKLTSVYASAQHVYMYTENGRIVMVTRGSGTVTTVATIANVVNMYVNNALTDTKAFSVAEITADQTQPSTWTAYGDASWITAFNAVKTTASTGSFVIEDIRIGSGYLVVLVSKAGQTYTWLYRINYDATITLTDVTATTDVRNHQNNTTVKLNTVLGISGIAGSYGHFVFTKPIAVGETLSNLYSFGDNSMGQLEITPSSAPFLGAAAGYGFTVTINSQNFAEFWGDSPDNSLFWRGGKYITAD